MEMPAATNKPSSDVVTDKMETNAPVKEPKEMCTLQMLAVPIWVGAKPLTNLD